MTDNSPFTPRTSSQSKPLTKATSPMPKKPTEKPLWQVWRPRLVQLARWTLKQTKQLWSWFVRYTRGLSRAQRLQHVGIICGLIVCLFVFNQIFSRHSPTPQAALTGSDTTPLPKGTPDFSTLLPSGKSIDKFGGWTRVSPTDRNAVYAYTDTLAQISIIVSEQPLPDAFKTDTEAQVRQLAAGYNAERSFEVGATNVYIGKSSKGPQSLIFTAHGLLVLIKSSATISDGQWATYITSLR